MIRRSTPWSRIALLCLLLLNIGCGNRITPSAELSALTGSALSLPDECAAVGERPKILFYVDAEGCTSCRLRITMQWFTQNRQVLVGMDSCAVMDTTGKWHPFEPAEFNPDGFRSVCANTRTPKIYRRTYSFDDAFYPKVDQADIPTLFKTFNRRDVTREYVSVSDVTVTPDRNLDKSNGISD